MSFKGSTGPPGGISRREFLRLSGITGAVLFGVMGPGRVLAQEGSTGPSLAAEFEEAAGEYEVPKELLLAMGYVNTRWEMPPPEASAHRPGSPKGRGAYGIMQLVNNDSANTLGDASRLTGIPEEELKINRRSNIFGGAALLADAQGERPARLGDYFGAVDGKGGRGRYYKAVAGVGAGELYAEQVFATLKTGASATIRSGEQIKLPPQEGQL